MIEELTEETVYDDMRDFVVKALDEMSFPVEGITDDTNIGPEGVGMDSLAFAEVIVQVEEAYGVRFDPEEASGSTDISLGGFAKRLVSSLESAKAEAS